MRVSMATTKSNGELTPKERAQRERLETKGIKPAIRHTSRQMFLFKDTQVYANRHTIQRVRSECIYWIKPTFKAPNGRCSLNRVSCKPSCCGSFIERMK